MTISASVNRISYAGNGSTTVFSFPYKFLQDADIKVIVVTNATGAESAKVLTTDFTVTGEGTDSSGEITMVVAPASTETLVIYSDPAIAQGTDYVNGGSLDVDNIENALDELTLIARRLDDRIDRTIRQPDGDVTDMNPLEPNAVRALRFLYFDADGHPVTSTGTLDTAISDYMYTLIDDEDAATARATLGLVIGTDVQAWDDDLDDIAALTPTDGNIIVGDGTNWVAESGATARASLGLTIGTDVQAWDTDLDDIAALTPTDGNIIVGDGTNWVAESGATARTSLGLGTGDAVTFDTLTATSGVTSNGNAVREVGRETVWLPAHSWVAATTNGPATGQTETTTNALNVKTLDFDTTTVEIAWFQVEMPKNWNEGTIIAKFHWTAASGSGTVTWDIAGVCISNDDALDAACGTAVSVTDTLITAEDNHVTAETSAVTLAGTPAEGDMTFLRIRRDVTDTLAVDAQLIGVSLYITTNAANDD